MSDKNGIDQDVGLGQRNILLAGAAPAVAPASAANIVTSAAQAQSAPQAPSGKPNVVFILADNVGYGDLGPYGGGELRGAPTPRIDQLAREGMKLTQFLVEPGCTPSRAALMTGRYSVREGLSLVIVPGSPNTLSPNAFTMGEMFHGLGYATAIFGKWHLGAEPQSLPTAHGFDEFYGIPPDLSWDSCTYVETMHLTQSINQPLDALRAKGPHVVEATLGESLREVKPFTPEVRAEIDNELVGKSIDFMKRQRDAAKPFFLYLPFSMGHFPNLPAKEFAGKSRIGNFGDKIMEGDYHVGEILDALKDLGIDDSTIVIFCSDNGPQGAVVREIGNRGTPDMGNSGPFRGELGDASEGSIRTFAFVRWPGRVTANTSAYAMFSMMDFLPTLASIVGGKLPNDRPIDGVDQSDVLFGRSATGNREYLLSFVGPEIVAARWKQWRIYFTDQQPTGSGSQRLTGLGATSAPMNGYPRVYNIEMDPREELNVAALFGWIGSAVFEGISAYERSVKEHPNPPAPNITRFMATG